MQSLLSSWFVQGMIKATSDMWLKSWDERNGGNVSLCLTPEDVAPYRAEFNPQPRSETLSAPVPALAGSYFLVTGSGKFFRNVQFSPADSLTLLQLNEEGTGYRILWGLIAGGGGLPTSELATHLQFHAVRKQVTDGGDRVIMHCHATNLIALSWIPPALPANCGKVVRSALWCSLTGWVLSPGCSPAPTELALPPQRKCTRIRWYCGLSTVFSPSGPSLDDAFGLIDTAEKQAEVMVKVSAMGGKKQTISRAELIALGERFGVTPMAAALDVEER
ncbi:Rhamnulose-1-phosphate aldolase [Sodalis glossinidius str. 'morsitans']|uniref:Rhamnulose-1-phosphate aldolase n=1 Tax=Sodalis glossinidius (strain morsitans) TaxID=343509 RepID=A0A193QM65_SODGM|nr:Rhamnulose-1-phosphate aldolase [Sodalis glossinidius str. 'morsitans']